MPPTDTEPQPLATAIPSFQSRYQRTPAEQQAIDEGVAQREAATAERQRQERREQLAGQLGQRYSRERVALERFTIYNPEQRKVVDHIRRLASDIDASIGDGQNVILFGPVGTGKDFLLANLLYAAVDAGHKCRWANGLDLYGQWRDQMDDGTNEQRMVAGFISPKVLAISDPIPPVGAPSAWNVSQLYRIIDARYRQLRPTWMTVNAASVEDANETLSAPLFDRLRHGAALIHCYWPSYRQRV